MVSTPSGSNPRSTSRSIIHLSTDRSSSFQSRQSPLLPPPTRRNELPFSSQSGPSERHSSPIKELADHHELAEPEAGPSRPSSSGPMQSSTGWSDDEDDFDGIEDAIATQSMSVEKDKGKMRASVTLEDLFDDEAEESEEADKDDAPVSSGSGIRSSADTRTRIEDLVDLSESPSPNTIRVRGSSPGLSGHHFHSDTPPSPLPKTPPSDDMIIPWSPSPVIQRTKKRTTDESPVSKTKKPAVTQPKATKKGKEKVVPVPEWEEEEEEEWGFQDDFPFPDDLDFGMMEPPSGPTSSTSRSKTADPGRSFRPSSITTPSIVNNTSYPSANARHSSPPRHFPSDDSRHSHIVSILDELDDPTRLRLISDLTESEQDFYRNHWRRGADKGSKKRRSKDMDDDEEEEEFEDGGFSGPQPTAKKKTFKRGGGFKRGGFRGRGRGKARGRSRK